MTRTLTMQQPPPSNRSNGRATVSLWMSVYCVSLAVCGGAVAQSRVPMPPSNHTLSTDRQKAIPLAGQTDLLKQLNASLETLVAKVSPAVVEVLVTGFGPVEENDETKTAFVGRQSKLGSGVIVDPDGYIITNAHVVSGARSIEVVVTTRSKDVEDRGVGKTSYVARLVGVHKDTDLALLKIDATALPYLPLDPKRPITQGQLVFALGNPEGLGNSVTMGVISAVDRQPDPRLPMVFIQTDAPINPGNSGGPLIDIDGYVLGINTFILSEGGGSEGLGFAIPAKVVSFIVDRLRKFGHVDRSEIGAASEAITPLLAKGLQLPVTSGVIIVDVKPGGPAESAGLKIGDIVLAIDDKEMTSLPQLAGSLYLHPTDELMKVNVLRGTDKLTFQVPVFAQKHDVDRLVDLVDPQKNLVRKIGVLALDLDDRVLGILPDLRIKSGVVVVANSAYSRAVDARLQPGDVIHSVNTKPILSLDDLRKELAAFHAGDAVVLQIERSDGMDYVAFEID
jgi:serine protease Do